MLLSSVISSYAAGAGGKAITGIAKAIAVSPSLFWVIFVSSLTFNIYQIYNQNKSCLKVETRLKLI